MSKSSVVEAIESKLFSVARRIRLLLLHVTCQSSIGESWSLSGIDQNRTHWTFRCHNLILANATENVFSFFSRKLNFGKLYVRF